MSKHTPGPWVVHPTSIHPAVRSVGTAEVGPRRICTVGSTNGNPIDLLNAHLIAAAPELLQALKFAVQQNEHDILMTSEELRQCRAAIAKATGEPA